VLFLDEPTAGVDLHGRAAIRELIAEQRSSGVTILMTTHEMAEAEAVADRVAILHRGRLARVGALADFTGGGVHFTSSSGLAVAELGANLGAPVREELPGRYVIEAESNPALISVLGAWLSQQNADLGEVRSGARLEDTYRSIVGELADETVAPPSPRRRSRRGA
jgi:ABC-2 type transport system ATP-binding protein